MDTFILVSIILLWVVVILQFGLFILLAKLVGQFLSRMRLASNGQAVQYSLGVGDQAPLFREKDQAGRMRVLAETEGKQTLLLFSQDGCEICARVIPELPKLQEQTGMRILVLSPDGQGEHKLGPDVPVSIIRSQDVLDSYMNPPAPTMMLLDEKNYIMAKESVFSSRQLEILILHHLKRAA